MGRCCFRSAFLQRVHPNGLAGATDYRASLRGNAKVAPYLPLSPLSHEVRRNQTHEWLEGIYQYFRNRTGLNRIRRVPVHFHHWCDRRHSSHYWRSDFAHHQSFRQVLRGRGKVPSLREGFASNNPLSKVNKVS